MEKDGVEEYQKKTVELLEELVKWTRFTSMPNVRHVLLDTLDSEEKLLAYYFSDGRSSREVSILSRADRGSLQGWWKKWIKAGLAEPVKVQRGERAKRTFSLDDFGIDIPTPKKPIGKTESDNGIDTMEEKEDE